MIMINLIYNVSVLLALSTLSGIINTKFKKNTTAGKMLQGMLFGVAVVVVMLYPNNLSQGINFDGRSIVISLCTLFFGPVSGIISSLIGITSTFFLGSSGFLTGTITIITSFFTGLIFYYLRSVRKIELSDKVLFFFGFLVSAVMIYITAAFFKETVITIVLTVIIFFPLITMLIGKFLINQLENNIYEDRLSEEEERTKAVKVSEERFRSIVEGVSDPIFILTDKKFAYLNTAALKLFHAQDPEQLIGKPISELVHVEFNKVAAEGIKAFNYDNKLVHNRFQSKFLTLDNEEVCVETSEEPIVYSDKKGVLVYVRGISEQQKHEEEFRRKEAERSFLIQTAIDGFWMVDRTGKLVDANDAACKMLGYSREEILGKSIPDFELVESKQNLKDHIKTIIRNGNEKFEFRHKRKNGEIIDLDVNAVWYKETKKFYIFVKDITEQKRSIEKLKASDKIFEHALDMFCIVGYDGYFKVLNPAWSKVLGWSTEELLSKPWIEFVHPEDAVRTDNIGETVADRMKIFQLVNRYLCKDGSIKWLSWNSYPYPEENIMFGVARDVTQQRISQEQLKRSEEKFKNLFLNHAAIKMLIDPDTGKIVDANNAAVNYYGWSHEELTNMNISQINVTSDEEFVSEKDKTKEPDRIRFEFKHKKADGSIRDVDVFSSKVEIDEKTFLHSIIYDSTDKKIAENMLKHWQELMQYVIKYDPTSIAVLDKNMNYIYVSERYIKDYRLAETNLVGKNHYNVFPEIPDKWKEVHKRVLNGEIIKSEEDFIVRGDGTTDYVNWEYRPWYDKSGGIGGIIMYSEVITKRKKVELEIRNSEERFRQLVLSTDDIIFTLDTEQRHTSIFGQWIEKPNLSPEFYIGKTAADIFGVEQSEIHQYHNALALNGRSVSYEWSIIEKNNKKYFQTSLSPLKDNNGAIYGLVGVGRDITQIKKSQESLAARESFLKAIIESSPTAIFSLDLTGNILTWNVTAEKMFGWKFDEIAGKKNPIVPYSKESEFFELINAVILGKSFSGKELIIQRKDGSTIHIRLATAPIYESADKIVGVMAVAEDITELVKAEQDLKEHDLRLRFALETSQIGAWDLNLVDHAVVRSIIHDNIFGYKKLLPEWTYEMLLEHVLPEDREKVDEKFKFAVKNRNNWNFECRIKRADGEIRWIWAAGRHYDINSETPYRMAGIIQDITNRKESELELEKYRMHLEKLVKERTEELDRLNKDLIDQLKIKKELEEQLQIALSKEKEINELKSRFIATVSHEFRTPLASILSSAQMIQRYSSRWSEEKLNEHYGRISSTINYLTQLLDDVLTISRVERDLLINNPEEINLDEMLNLFYEELKPSLRINHELIFSNNCKDKNIFIDKKLFRHIAINLLTNAIKYSPSGGAVLMEIDTINRVLLVTVSDNGIGIEAKEMKHIFDPYYRAKNSISIQGSGLGLNIARRAVEILGGEITVKSELNKGTKFFVRIPLHDKK
jgi:PAS domain S-box-containing protein